MLQYKGQLVLRFKRPVIFNVSWYRSSLHSFFSFHALSTHAAALTTAVANSTSLQQQSNVKKNINARKAIFLRQCAKSANLYPHAVLIYNSPSEQNTTLCSTQHHPNNIRNLLDLDAQ